MATVEPMRFKPARQNPTVMHKASLKNMGCYRSKFILNAAESDHYGYSRRYLSIWIIKVKNKSEQFRRNETVRICLFWWTRGESNPCPKIYSYSFLRAKFIFWNSPFVAPINRLCDQVAFLFMTASKANGLCTFTAVWRRVPSRGGQGSDALH